jgi:hypothetical protein
MMHPTELMAYGRARHEDLLRAAEAYRLGRAVAPPRRAPRVAVSPTARWRLALLAAVLAGGALATQVSPTLLRAWSG